jgi:ATP-dependent RNA helicase DDX19/DBP5
MVNSIYYSFLKIVSLYASLTVASSIIFTYTQSSAVWLAEQLKGRGCEAALLHGELPVGERAAVINAFKNGRQRVLITTNVSSRGYLFI